MRWFPAALVCLFFCVLSAAAQAPGPGDLVGGIYLSSPPTLANQQKQTLQLDNAGNLKVNVASGGGSGGTSSSFGAAFPATGTAAGFEDGSGNMAAAKVDASNNLNVNCQSGCAGGSFNNNSDAVATSATNGQAAAWLYGFNGTTFDRLRVDASKNLDVNVNAALPAGANSIGAVTANAGTNLNTSALALETGGNLATTATNTGTLAGAVTASVVQTNEKQINGVAPSMGNGVSGTGVQRVTIASDSTGQVALAAGSATIGALTANQSVNLAQIAGTTTLTGNGTAGAGAQRVTIASDNTAFNVNAEPTPVTSGGLSICFLTAAASTNATNCKASAGQVYAIRIFNNSSTIAYLSLYNTAGTPSCGTSIVDEIMVPGITGGTGAVHDIALGEAFGTGIGLCLTTAIGGTGSVAASTYLVTILYK